MTTVAELIAHLQTLPQEAVVRAYNSHGDKNDLNLEIGDVSLTDFREGANQFVKEGDPRFGKVFVDIEAF